MKDTSHTREKEVQKRFLSYDGWYIKSFNTRLFSIHIQESAVTEAMRQFDTAMQQGVAVLGKNNMMYWGWRKSEMLEKRQLFVSRVLEQPEYLATIEKHFSDSWDDYILKEAQYVAHTAVGNELDHVQTLLDLIEAEIRVGGVGYLTDCFLSFGETDWLFEWIDKELPLSIDNREQLIADLVTPVEHSFVQQEKMDLLRIALESKNEIEGLLQEHARKWSWIQNSYLESEPLTTDYFKQELVNIDVKNEREELSIMEQAPERKRKTKEEIIERFHFSEQLKTVITLASSVSHITDTRKMGVLRINQFLFPFLRALSKESGHSYETVCYALHTEIPELLATQDWSHVKERQTNGCVSLFDHGQEFMMYGPTTEQYGELLLSSGKTKVLKGQIAFKGVVTARARIITKRDQFNTFLEGEVLITNQTTPEFVPLMKKASAVVTEQGGITCHAAIISRELKTPCIIGMERATESIPDGALITVNADLGIVQIIQQS